MKYFVTQVNFAFDEEWISKTNREAITEDHWGIWEATDHKDVNAYDVEDEYTGEWVIEDIEEL